MTTRAWASAAVLALATACAHARHVGEGRDQGQGQGQAQGSAKSHRATAAPPRRQEDAGSGGAAAKVPAREGHPAVASSPAALMQPGGARKIQQALAAHGALDPKDVTGKLDDRTAAALRRFQGRENIAQTGAPDAETLSRLGLEPVDIYQAAKPEKQGTATQEDVQR